MLHRFEQTHRYGAGRRGLGGRLTAIFTLASNLVAELQVRSSSAQAQEALYASSFSANSYSPFCSKFRVEEGLRKEGSGAPKGPS
jgi:hypothetical protein